MLIALDLDEVLYEWERTARYLLREYRGYHHLTDVSAEWDSIPKDITPEDWNWLWTEGIRLGLFRYGHVKTGAILGMRALLERGHTLEVVTSRPESAARDTDDWVRFLKVPFKRWYMTDDKTESEADLLIDDRPKNIEPFLASGRKAILFDHPWNEGFRFVDYEGKLQYHRAYDWRDVVRCVDVLKEGR